MMSAVMAIALICGSRYGEGTSDWRIAKAKDCQIKLSECYEKELGDLDTRLIKCIRKGN